MQSDRNSFCGDSSKIAYKDEDSILDKIDN